MVILASMPSGGGAEASEVSDKENATRKGSEVLLEIRAQRQNTANRFSI